MTAEWDRFWGGRRPAGPSEPAGDGWSGAIWDRQLRYWAEVFERAPGRRILECGSGSARVSLHMAERDYRCVMLDYSAEGLDLGRSAFARAGLEGASIRGDVTALPFGSGAFDIVSSGGLLHHLEDVDPPIEEMVRVLRPGGVFAAVVIPKKFSCQTLGDIQTFWARLLQNVVRLDLQDVIARSRRSFPFYENSIALDHYRGTLDRLGVDVQVATGTSPFPSLALPGPLRSLYGRLMTSMDPVWDRFDGSTMRFTEIWGAAYTIHGVKRP